MNILRGITISAVSVLAWGASLPVSAHGRDVEQLLSRLDSVVAHPQAWESIKQHRIAELRHKEPQIRTIEERYWYNKNLYEEYAVFNADSAMAYADRNYAIAERLGDEGRKTEWLINKSFLLSVTGLLKEAQDVIEDIDEDKVPADLRSSYYNQLAYLYSHYGQYMGAPQNHPGDYYVQSTNYQDSTFKWADSNDQFYLWYKGWTILKGPAEERGNFITELKEMVDSSRMDTRTDAMNAYLLARLYEKNKDEENRIKYLAVSAICDVMTANKDIASLEELGKIMLAEGDIDRAYSYVNFCRTQAQEFNNRVRSVTLANSERAIHDVYSQRDRSQQARLSVYLGILAMLSLILVVATIVLIRKNKSLKESRSNLNSLNERLSNNVTELSALRDAQEETNRKLKEMNEQLTQVNDQLKESNVIKEEYVGQVFSLCSEYINKLEEFRKDVSRKLKVGQTSALMKSVESSTMVQNELKEFYRTFDTIFLNLFPDFVKDFNALLRPEEQIVLGEGDLLNTPLRIYALVRLGITDSVKIAALLHYSAQTVYNNRLRMRNKAIIPRETFADAVRNLGYRQEV